eukprot:4645812-Pleurochrysis_carterae.AAC.2
MALSRPIATNVRSMARAKTWSETNRSNSAARPVKAGLRGSGKSTLAAKSLQGAGLMDGVVPQMRCNLSSGPDAKSAR